MKGKSNDFWLDNDPEWKALREKQSGQPKAKLSRAQRKQLREAQFQAELRAQQQKPQTSAPQPAPPTTPAASISSKDSADGNKKIDVSLNLSLPRVDLKKAKTGLYSGLNRVTPPYIKKRLRKRSRKQLVLAGSCSVVLVIAAIGIVTLMLKPGKQSGDTTDKAVLAQQTVKIDFKPLLPNGKDSETTAHKTAEDGQGRPIYTFTDKVGNADLTVTEQPLPESLKGDTDTKMEKMAKDLYLTEVINASNPKAYLGTSVKGPQTVIFTKNGLLVFIQSQSKLDKDQWSDYVTRLIQ